MKEIETDRGVKTFCQLARPFTSAYVYQCGLVVRAHPADPASSAAITLRFPTRSETIKFGPRKGKKHG